MIELKHDNMLQSSIKTVLYYGNQCNVYDRSSCYTWKPTQDDYYDEDEGDDDMGLINWKGITLIKVADRVA